MINITPIRGCIVIRRLYVREPRIVSPRYRQYITIARPLPHAPKSGLPLQSSVSLTFLAIAAACVVFGGSIALASTPETPSVTWDAPMAPTIQPGRPGNLTVEQEVKLQEFWKRTLEVFGVALLDGHAQEADAPTEEPEEAEINGVSKTSTGLTAEKKKKRKGLFSRKRKDSKIDAQASKAAATAATESDDKYGQTKAFHAALAQNLPEELRQAFWSMVKHDHPDGLLLRFLRARKWDIEKALVMMVSTMQWRAKEMHVDDDIVVRGEGGALRDSASADAKAKRDGNDLLAQLRMGKSFLHGVDREGRPMCTVRVRLHKQGEQTEPSLERFTVHVLETARLLLVPPVDTATIVFDMTGFSMANMDYTPVKFMIKCFEANYPESLGVILVHKAPWVFQGIWKIIRGWLDPVVAGKVHFTNATSELEQFIARDRILQELGGDDPYKYAYPEPLSDENAAMADTATRDRLQQERASVVKEFEAVTREWAEGPQTSEQLRDRRNEIADRLKMGYWELDPYVRARCLLDRTGVIGKDGRISFYPSQSAPVASVEAPHAGKSATGAGDAPTMVPKADDVD